VPSSDARANIEIAAPPETVYALVTDLDVLAELAEETATMRWAKGNGAVVGAVFRGANRNGWRRWTTTCAVTAAEPGSHFAFEVSHTRLPVTRWSYDIRPRGQGCVVTESTQDRRPRWFAAISPVATGVADRGRANEAHIEATCNG
jgi:Polyketide cyclase / dehydrase and lipid transport